jgi:putative hydrolase of the HAD superfamily
MKTVHAQTCGAVLFDLHGTLVRFRSRGRSWRDVLAGNGIDFDPHVAAGHVSQAADGSTHREASLSRSSYRVWEKNRIAAMIRAHGVTGDIEALIEEVHREWSTWTMTAYPEVVDVLSALRRADIKVVVCTNWTWDAETALEQAGLIQYIDGVVVSARVGARKPHPAMFRAALKTAGVAASAAVFVGDEWRADVGGSLAVGMCAFHVDRAGSGTPTVLAHVMRAPDLRCLPAAVKTLPW